MPIPKGKQMAAPSRAWHPQRPQDIAAGSAGFSNTDRDDDAPEDMRTDAERMAELIDSAVDRFAMTHKPGTLSRSRRDGYEPNHALHVHRYLVQATTGATVTEIAADAGLHRSTVSRSIRRGQRLIQEGFSNPDGDDE